MRSDDDWDLIEPSVRGLRETGMGLIRLALLFGVIAVAFTLILVPTADETSRSWSARNELPAGVDNFTTGSVRRLDNYTIRRSVLQSNPSAGCIIRSYGQREGDC
ncbi:hypothetical protein GA830_02045 [Mesorhizobium sp. NBSH29]|uniref:hypothetical protein n=1 Tax=Mesorhizobium sp. NBSH29 TaxID=2654249 RepID=UPI0018964E1C|nr:hypothetical protein [Mesorhizobium sp. NBSH29]QPC85648.1 hypothetical protein GA830_02045 [Mesorhizobium sp. NBSH29]